MIYQADTIQRNLLNYANELSISAKLVSTKRP